MADSRIGVCVHGVALNTWCARCPSGKRYQITVSGTTASNTQETPETAQAAQADEPRAIVQAFALAMEAELARARAKHGPMHSHHEAYAVLLEELDEVWDEVKRQTPDPQRIIAELVQVAAVCARWAEDVCGALPPTDARGR